MDYTVPPQPQLYTCNASQDDYDDVWRDTNPRPDRPSGRVLALVLALLFIVSAIVTYGVTL